MHAQSCLRQNVLFRSGCPELLLFDLNIYLCYIISMNINTFFAYTAGYIDGDGCFYIGKYTDKKTGRIRYQSMLIISSTNRSILKEFSHNFGGSVRLSDNRLKHPGQRPQYQFIIKGKKALHLTKNIQPYLVEKAQEAENFCVSIDQSKIYDFIEWSNRLRRLYKVTILCKKQLTDWGKNYPEIPSETDYAYLAGLIDAECCLSIQHYKPRNKPNVVYRIILSLNNTRRPIFQWIMERFGGRLHFIDRQSKNKKHSDQLMWNISGKALSKILPFITPYLHYKKPVCEELMNFYQTTLKNGGARHTEEFRISYAKIIEEREKIIHKVHQLNKKGI